MFVLRCVFWLGLVYASLSWRSDAFDTTRVTLPLAASRMVDGAVAGLSDLCRRQPARCLADAARLTALIGDDSAGMGDSSTSVPRPVPDPRRHGRGTGHAAMLTALP